MRDDPEALVWMMDDGDIFLGGWGDGPRASQEVEGVVGIEATLEVDGQMQIEQRDGWSGTELRTFFFVGQVPSGIWG